MTPPAEDELLRENRDLRARIAELEEAIERRRAPVLTRQLFEALFSHAPIGVYLIQDSTFALVNRKFQRDLGYALADLAGSAPLDLVVPEDRERVRRSAAQMLKGERSAPYEYRSRDGSGETRSILESVASCPFEGRRAALGFYMDITERRRIEEDSRRSAEEVARLELLNQTALTLSHHVLNALTPVLGVVDKLCLADAMPLNELALHEGLRIAAIVDAMIEVSARHDIATVPSMGPDSDRMLDIQTIIDQHLQDRLARWGTASRGVPGSTAAQPAQ